MNESPPGNGTGARQGADPQNESDTQLKADSAAVVNRTLIKSKRGLDLDLFEVMERRRRYHYEIVCGSQRWSFPLL